MEYNFSQPRSNANREDDLTVHENIDKRDLCWLLRTIIQAQNVIWLASSTNQEVVVTEKVDVGSKRNVNQILQDIIIEAEVRAANKIYYCLEIVYGTK